MTTLECGVGEEAGSLADCENRGFSTKRVGGKERIAAGDAMAKCPIMNPETTRSRDSLATVWYRNARKESTTECGAKPPV